MEIAAYGTWPSPLSPAVMGGARISLAGLQVVGDTVWWSESRPHEGGRMAVMRLAPGRPPEEVSPREVSVRSRVHEYGGGAHFADAHGLLYTALADQALWWLAPGGAALRLTPVPPTGEDHRYADARPVPGGRHLVALRERHHARAGGDEPVVDDEVVAVDRSGDGAPTVLVGGRDFFAAPRPSPDGRRLAWLAWDHPNMPWDGTELWVADLEPDGDGERLRLGSALCVAGGPDESVGQPTWAGPDLWFVSDRAGYWQPYRWRPGGPPLSTTDLEADFAGPDWALGQTTIDIAADGSLLCRFRSEGRDGVGLGTTPMVELDQDCVTIAAVRAGGERAHEVVVMGSAVDRPPALYRITGTKDPGGAAVEELYRPTEAPLPAAWVSVPRSIAFPTPAGVSASMLYFAPHSPDRSAPPGERPPLVVVCHGGPTAGAEPGFDASVQMWTTRGVAVAVVDYRGSTGHGRAFRRLLDGRWGVADAEDCRAAARFLADEGLVDGSRMVVKGSSAGGLTALRCLDRGGPFAAAVVAYGVTDLAALAADTHKFESRYMDRLVGPWPEAADVYEDRSPACHPERVAGAVLLLQGSDDPIVPPDQAERLVAALRERGVRCDHVVFRGEGHGFRQAETLVRCAELEIAFVGDVLGIDTAP